MVDSRINIFIYEGDENHRLELIDLLTQHDEIRLVGASDSIDVGVKSIIELNPHILIIGKTTMIETVDEIMKNITKINLETKVISFNSNGTFKKITSVVSAEELLGKIKLLIDKNLINRGDTQ